jgi:antitoxin CcdA
MSLAKQATNLSIDAEVVREGRSLGINLSQACEAFLRDYIKREKERRWLEENAAFIASYNETVEKEGLALAEWKSF